ncbi:MAG TPA: type VII secretion target [Pseudonocardiaceae bacterium]|nr:type VII secretion target [Pseudonocardiaceae bacterium]
MATTDVNPEVMARTKTAITEQADRFDTLNKAPTPKVADDMFGPGDDAAALAKTVRAFDSVLTGELGRTAGLLHGAASSVGGSAEMFQAVEDFNAGTIKPV